MAKLISTTRLLTLQLAANQGANHPDYQKTIQPTRQPGSQSASQPAIQQSSQHVTHKTLHSCKHQRKSFVSLIACQIRFITIQSFRKSLKTFGKSTHIHEHKHTHTQKSCYRYACLFLVCVMCSYLSFVAVLLLHFCLLVSWLEMRVELDGWSECRGK